MSDYSADDSVRPNSNGHRQPRQTSKAVANTAVRAPAKKSSKATRVPPIANHGAIAKSIGQRSDRSLQPKTLQSKNAVGEHQIGKSKVTDVDHSGLLSSAAVNVHSDASQGLLDYLAAVDAITQRPQPFLPPFFRSPVADAATRPLIQCGSEEHGLLINIGQLVHTCTNDDLATQGKLLRQIITFKQTEYAVVMQKRRVFDFRVCPVLQCLQEIRDRVISGRIDAAKAGVDVMISRTRQYFG
jgi:hypothetical protein